MSVKDIDRGYDKFLEDVKSFVNEPYVKAGVLGQSGLEKDENGFTVVDIASVNEFGSEDGSIPERSFIRATIDKRRNRIYGFAFKMMGLVVDGKISVTDGLGRIGELLRSNIIQTMTDLRSPANAASTIRQKGSSNPLIDTGRTRASVSYEVKKK